MAAIPLPVAGERQSLLEFLRYHHAAFVAVFVPEYVQRVCEDAHWTARWALMNINEEMARHAGHADLIRESIDGATMFPPRKGDQPR